ncbi:asparagine synthase-related protein [Cupriavidus sp.]|uniref:asparagine synthase-related protein n=1 Tax=Cupriavidus sp. TaxID=1873897 RepID=UPI003D13F01C
MCGIAGELRFDQVMADLHVVAVMTRDQAPRGPDGEGLFSLGSRAFGHRRLRIMDLSQRAHQPFIDNELGLGVVFNGAIYNHEALRKELAAQGYRFASSGDTEVIIKAWHAWGPAALDRFAGMFAFALWERDSGVTHLVRDRLGIKPLYYSATPQRLRFASTRPALLAGGDINTTLDPVALHHYLSLHAAVPVPHTILQAVRKLPPATHMSVQPDGRTDSRTWWRLDFSRKADDLERPFEAWRDLRRATLRDAVRRRTVADVPVGVLLSGGVDSSLITSLPAETGTPDLRTYAIGFETVDGEAGEEFRYSDLVSSVPTSS